MTKRVHVPISLRWGDLDAYDHVNNVEMLRLLEEVRVRAIWRGEAGSEQYPTAVVDNTPDTGTRSLISRHEIEYLAPVPYGRAPLDVELWFSRIGGAAVEICYEVYSPIGVEPRVLYARCSTSMVQVDAASGRPTRLTAEMREAWGPYLGDPTPISRR